MLMGIETVFSKYAMKGSEIEKALEFLEKIGYKRAMEKAVSEEDIKLINEIHIKAVRNALCEDEIIIKIIIYDDRDIINFGKEITISQNILCNKLEEIHKVLQEMNIEHYTWRK